MKNVDVVWPAVFVTWFRWFCVTLLVITNTNTFANGLNKLIFPYTICAKYVKKSNKQNFELRFTTRYLVLIKQKKQKIFFTCFSVFICNVFHDVNFFCVPGELIDLWPFGRIQYFSFGIKSQKLRIKIWFLCGRASVNFSCFWIRLSFELSIFFCSGNKTVFAFAKKLLDFLIFTFLSVVVVDCCFGVPRARVAGNNCDNFSAHALGLRELWVMFNTNFPSFVDSRCHFIALSRTYFRMLCRLFRS